jgi:hypothetical protein
VDTRTHVITGDRSQVGAALDRARADGRLMAITQATLLPGDQVRLVADLLTAPGSRWQRVRPWLIGIGKTLAVLAVIAAATGLVWALVWAVMAVVAFVAGVVAWIHTHLLDIGLAAAGVVALVLFLGASTGGGCRGLHCGGCRR